MDSKRVQEARPTSEEQITTQLLNDIQHVVDEMKEQDVPKQEDYMNANVPSPVPRPGASDTSALVIQAAERQLDQVRSDLKEAYSEQEYWRVRVDDLEHVERTLDSVRGDLMPKDTASGMITRDPSQFSNSKY